MSSWTEGHRSKVEQRPLTVAKIRTAALNQIQRLRQKRVKMPEDGYDMVPSSGVRHQNTIL